MSKPTSEASTAKPSSRPGLTAFLLDRVWPEYDAYVSRTAEAEDSIFTSLPATGRFSGPLFSWKSSIKHRRKKIAWKTGVQRAFALRKVRTGAALQKTRLKFDESLAKQYRRFVSNKTEHLVICQNLLPFLTQADALKGRSYDVLMYRHPITSLQAELDQAFALHPESTTLSDFRVDPAFAQLEDTALDNARKVITPHAQMASRFPDKSIRLEWHVPQGLAQERDGDQVLFPAHALGSKGAFEARQIARDLGIGLTVQGRPFEGPEFWDGVSVKRASQRLFDGVGLVLLPAFLEGQPRILLEAAARGIPVVTTEATGLTSGGKITVVATGDYEALKSAVSEQLAGSAMQASTDTGVAAHG